MARTPAFQQLKRLLTLARKDPSPSRRDFLTATGSLAAAGAIASLPWPVRQAFAGPRRKVDVGIVGAGLAGLACGYELKKAGLTAKLYDANTRIGGRCWSLRGVFPGQVAERGGELIDNLHKTMIGYAREFGLTLEDVGKSEGDVTYFFNGTWYPESVVVAEFRQFVDAMHVDLRSLSGEVTALAHTDADIALDRVSLADYLAGRNGIGLAAGPIAREAITQAYLAEYGLEASEQSCLNFLLFIHADKRSKFTPFGIFSDERFHIVEGNDAVASGLASRLSGQIELESKLVRARKTAGGRVELTFRRGNTTFTRTHEAVVFATPFTTLRQVELDSNLGLSPEKRYAIANLGYGNNAKMMIGYQWRPWAGIGGSGAAYANLPNFQATWETNPTLATPARAILTDYSSGERGARLDPRRVQAEAERFLTDGDRVFPGLKAAASRAANGRDYLVHLEHWPSNPLTLGSYTCYKPGQFTTIAGHEGTPEGNVYFAGEHTNSFYEWQGFMEGAALSGIDAAAKILA